MLKILDKACTPKRATKYSAYIDLFSREDYEIRAGDTVIIKLGIVIDDKDFNDDFKQSHYLEVALRSSLAVRGLIISNGIGIIDLDYKNEIGLIVYNTLEEPFRIKKGDKVAQCTIKEHFGRFLGYDTTEVRTGGFGSTGR